MSQGRLSDCAVQALSSPSVLQCRDLHDWIMVVWDIIPV